MRMKPRAEFRIDDCNVVLRNHIFGDCAERPGGCYQYDDAKRQVKTEKPFR